MIKPKELYKFTEGLQSWTFTSSDTSEIYNSENYESIAIGRDEVEDKNELSKANLTVSVSIDNDMGKRWMKSILDTIVTLTIFCKDEGLTNVVWKGRLSSVKPEDSIIKLIFESIFTSLRRPGLRGKYQRSCPHVLYGRGCNLNKDDFAVNVAITTINGVKITAPDAALQPDGFYNAGMIEGPDGALRFIVQHVGTQLTLIRPLDSLSEGLANTGYGQFTANIYPGCDRTKETCLSKFANLNNYGGFPFIPLNNPMAGSSIV